MSELKPCPFCGGEARIYINDRDLDNILYYCMCTNDNGCDVQPVTLDHYSEAEAAAAWNTRTDYHGYEQAAIEAWKSVKKWNTRHVETCRLPETYIDHGSIEYNGTTSWRLCSACGAEVLADPANYCPNCGRKVEG